MKFLIQILLLILFSNLKAQNPSYNLLKDDEGMIAGVEIKGTSKVEDIKIYSSKDSQLEIMGQWDKKVFYPVLPLDPLQDYYIQYYRGKWIQIQKQTHQKEYDIPIVKHIYPTSDTLPENLLRFYVEFSQPMKENYIHTHIRLFDAEGKELDGVFLNSRYEYWNKEHTKVTIILDPGRVKTGLMAHKKMGRALSVHKYYTLKINAQWPAMNGETTKLETTKSFTVVPEVLEKLKR